MCARPNLAVGQAETASCQVVELAAMVRPMTDLDVIEKLLAEYAADPGRSKAAQLADRLGTYAQAVTHMVTRKRIPVGLRMRAFKLAKAAGLKLDVEWLVSPPKPGKRKGKANGGTRVAAKGKRNGQRKKPKGRKATARKSGRQGAQRAAV